MMGPSEIEQERSAVLTGIKEGKISSSEGKEHLQSLRELESGPNSQGTELVPSDLKSLHDTADYILGWGHWWIWLGVVQFYGFKTIRLVFLVIKKQLESWLKDE